MEPKRIYFGLCRISLGRAQYSARPAQDGDDAASVYVSAADYDNCLSALRQAKAELTAAKREIEVLRQYGNKDCTAMADEALKGEKS